jgi:PASTA domain
MAVDGRPIPEAGAGVAIRRRRAVITLASAAVVVTVIGGTVLASTFGGAADPGPPAGSPSPIVTPPGTRLVGAGHAAIAVPVEWGANKTHCGVPQQDTVVIDVAAIELCGTRRPRGVDSVEIWTGPPRFDYHADGTTVIDGVPAERQNTTCAPDLGGRPICAGTIYLRSLRVMFIADSSTSRAEVDRVLSWIRIVPDLVGVPGFNKINVDAQINADEQGGAKATYLDVLQRAGLTAQIHTRTVHASPTGYILAVSPVPGTMVRPGTVVTVTVVAEPQGPADEVDVGINSVHWPEEVYHDLTDAQIRAGATIELKVGDQIWAYATGKRARTLAGQLDGTSLAVENPNYPPRWVAASEGTTKITLTITADGEPVVLGTVTVLVR